MHSELIQAAKEKRLPAELQIVNGKLVEDLNDRVFTEAQQIVRLAARNKGPLMQTDDLCKLQEVSQVFDILKVGLSDLLEGNEPPMD